MSPPPKTGALLWLHDMGELSPHAFRSAVGHHVPWLEIVTPAAGRRAVTCRYDEHEKMTPAWFDVARLPIREALSTHEGLADAIRLVHERLDDVLKVIQCPSTRVAIGGFGQGGALAIAAAISYREPLAGILCHSAWIVLPPADTGLGTASASGGRDGAQGSIAELKSSANAATPLMLINGTDDEHVDHACVAEGASALRELGMGDVHFKPFEGVEHKMSGQTANLSVDFLRARLPSVAPKEVPKGGGEKDQPAGAAAPAKSETVIVMNRRRQGGGAAAPSAPTAPQRKQQPPQQPQPQPQQRPAPSSAPAKPTPPAAKEAAAPPPSKVSDDAATARALRERDEEQLRSALARRGDDQPLSGEEMMAIAEMMLGKEGGKVAQAAMGEQRGADSRREAAEAKAKAQPPPPAARPPRSDPPAHAPSAAPAASEMPSPGYELTEGASELKLVVKLPESVKSMAQLELNLSSTRVVVSVDGAGFVDLELPRAVDDAGGVAKFAKKAGELRLTIPWMQ